MDRVQQSFEDTGYRTSRIVPHPPYLKDMPIGSILATNLALSAKRVERTPAPLRSPRLAPLSVTPRGVNAYATNDIALQRPPSSK